MSIAKKGFFVFNLFLFFVGIFKIIAEFCDFYDNAKNSSGMERYWLCSSKFAVFVPDQVPLWTAYSYGQLSLQAQIANSPYVGFYVSYLLMKVLIEIIGMIKNSN